MGTSAFQNTTFASNGGQAHGYLRLPDSGSGPAVIVIQEWWGLTTHIASIVDRLAADGFVALAPDLYGGPTTHDAAEAKELMLALPIARAAKDLAGAVDFLLEYDAVTSSTVGVVGFCMGGGFVLALAADQGERISAAVPFYGLPVDAAIAGHIKAALQGHFGTADPSIPLPAAEAFFEEVGTSGNEVELHVYDAGHAFLNDENLIGTYDPDNATLAWGRAVEFLRSHVR